MSRTFLSIVAGLLVSSTASSATPVTDDAALAERIARAQATTVKLLEELAKDKSTEGSDAKSETGKLAQHFHNFHNDFHNFHNHGFHNFHNH